MKLSNVLIAVFVIVFGGSLAFSQGKCETSYLTSPSDWVVADAGSVPYTVVTRVPVRDHNVECEFNVYVDQRHFDLDDLKQIGDWLHKAYQPLCCILVRITTSKNELIGTAVALKKGLSSLVLLPQFRIRCVLGVMALTLIFTLGVGASCSLRVVGDEDALAVGVVVSQDTLVGAHPAP